MSISDAFEAFEIDELLSEGRSQKTLNAYRCTLNSFLRATGSDITIFFITHAHIIQWKRYMHECGNSTAHMALQLREFRRVLAYLKSHGYNSLDPSEIKIPKFTYNTRAWLTIEEVRRFLSVIESPRDKALFGSMFSSGARISELLSLNKDSINGDTASVVGKGKVVGNLHFDANARKLIETYLNTRTDTIDALFISRQSRRIGVQQCIRLADKYAKMAGIEKKVTTHVLRHSFGTDLELNGADIRTISLQMRHKKLETTKIYLHAEELRKRPDYQRYHTPVPIE